MAYLALWLVSSCFPFSLHIQSQVALVVKNSPANEGDTRDLGSIPMSGRSPGGEHGNPLQDSCLENPHGQRILVGYSPWHHKELDTTEWLSTWTLNGFSFTASQIVVVQSLSCVWLFETLWTTALQASLSFIISWSLLRLMSIELMMLSNCNYSWYILDINPLSYIGLTNLSVIPLVAFYSVDCVIWWTCFKTLIYSHLFIFTFVAWDFCVISKKTL